MCWSTAAPARGISARICASASRSPSISCSPHTHLDHICGLPFFKPAYDPRFEVNAWAGHFLDETSLVDIVERIMSPPIFPVAAKTLKAVNFRTFQAGDTLPAQ
ncbi:hypothetical protein [uncultured Roseibium sp.]|uniref:hypothetical protein n=1 Tax=uncultured Roseibium sp. TaxID=1936171 RepID=UPI003216AB59